MSKSFIFNIIIAIVIYFIINYLDLANGFAVFWVILTFWSFLCYLITKLYYARIAKALIKTAEQQLTNKITLDRKTKRTYLIQSTPGMIYEMSDVFWILLIILIFRSFIYEPFQIPSGSMESTIRVGDFIGVDKNYYRLADPIFQKTLYKNNEVKRGDVIVFKTPIPPSKEDWIKRVIGIPGDKIVYNPLTREVSIYKNCTTNTTCNQVPVKYGEYKVNQDFFYYNNFQLERNETLTDNNSKEITHSTLQNPIPVTGYEQIYFHQPNQPINTWIVPLGQYFVMGDNRDNSEDSRFIGFIPYENIVGKAKYILFSLDKQAGGSIKGVRWDRTFTKIP